MAVYLILHWDINETKLSGPYDSPEAAQAHIGEDRRDNDAEGSAFLENTTVIGPLPEANFLA